MKKVSLMILVTVIMCLILTQTVFAEITNGLLAKWKFDEMTGTTFTDSVSNNNGIIYNATWIKNGTNSGSLNYDGINDWARIPHNNSLESNQKSIEFWFYPREVNRPMWFLNKGNGGVSFSISGYSGWNIKLQSGAIEVDIFDSLGYRKYVGSTLLILKCFPKTKSYPSNPY